MSEPHWRDRSDIVHEIRSRYRSEVVTKCDIRLSYGWASAQAVPVTHYLTCIACLGAKW